MKRRAAWLLCGLDLLLYLALVAMLAFGGGGEVSELGKLARVTVTLLFLLTALPALLLTHYRRAPDLALAFALAFPASFALLLLTLA